MYQRFSTHLSSDTFAVATTIAIFTSIIICTVIGLATNRHCDAETGMLAVAGLANLSGNAVRARRRAKEAAAHLSLALGAAKAAVWQWDIATDKTHWSEGQWDLLGLPADAVPSWQAKRARIFDEDLLRVDISLQTAIREGRVQLVNQFRIHHPCGCRWLLGSCHLSYDAEGNLARIAGVNVDITRLKETEARLDTARRAAERANAAKSTFLAAANHDLRQPAQSLALLHAALVPQAAGTASEKVVRMMGQAIAALNELLDSLLEVSRLDAGIVDAHPTMVAVGPLLDRLAAEYATRAERAGLRLHRVATKATATTDPLLLERILRNLIENGLRYTSSGGVVIGCQRRAGRLALVVADSGLGIPADQTEAVFEEFVQLHNSARDRRRGLGLGLAIVRRLAVLLRADLQVRSCPGHGSRFLVILPPDAEPAPESGAYSVAAE